MAVWTFGQTASRIVVLVIVSFAIWPASSVHAQHKNEHEPSPLPPAVHNSSTDPSSEPEKLAPLVISEQENQPESGVEQAQFTRPGKPASTSPSVSGNVPTTRPVVDPPSPMVRIQVRVPSDSAPAEELRYIITVQNTSQADAHQVTVRNPIPEGIEKVIRTDPERDTKEPNPKQLVWNFGTLRPGDRKTIELVFKPRANVQEVKNLAYVRFEHGEQVTTRINGPAVKVAKSAPKQSIHGEPFTVRVVVENTGRVPAKKVRVVEDVERTAEVEGITAGATKTNSEGNQWQWEVGTLLPGERKVIEYRVTPRLAVEALTLTNVQGDNDLRKTAEARTEILKPGLGIKLTGSKGVINPGDTARYEITVRNTGTMPSTNVQVVGTIPQDCKPTMKTEGGQVQRGTIVWTIPRLEPGAAQSFRFGLRADKTAQRTVKASAVDARKTQASDEASVLFQAVAALIWETELEPAERSINQTGTFTVRVRNNGGGEARNVTVDVDLPEEVGFKRSTPEGKQMGNKLVFGPVSIGSQEEVVYTVTYEARRAAHARFRAKLTADSLMRGPLEAEKTVSITGGSK